MELGILQMIMLVRIKINVTVRLAAKKFLAVFSLLYTYLGYRVALIK
ncbi:hypothetical protein BCI9360_02292 [Bacillus sp. CECT 9360]|nr:hypothetical protein BCI9360_02292 [Bacillus sp. CECT 9360]